jgi:predicted transposase YdaD
MGIEEFLLNRENKAGIKIGKEIGKEEGIEIGIRTKEVLFVLHLHDDGFDLDRISRLTGISEEQVLHILKENERIK